MCSVALKKVIKKRKFKSIEEKISDNCDPRKTKMIIDFNESESASIKAFSVRKKNVIKATARFMSSNLIMFAKLSFKSLIYDLSDIFSFPNEIVKEIYKKINKIDKIICFHLLTDIDSTSIQFIIISDKNSEFPKSNVREIIFEIIVKTKILRRFDTSHVFFGKNLMLENQIDKKKRGLN